MVISVRVPVRPEYQDFISEVIKVTKQEFSTDISTYSVSILLNAYWKMNNDAVWVSSKITINIFWKKCISTPSSILFYKLSKTH